MKILIIDDEEDARANIRFYIESYIKNAIIIGEAEDIASSIELIEHTNPDVVFLDIQLTDGSGFDLLERLENINFNLVFVTAYDQYAIKAFKYSAVDYILKPIDRDDFKSMVKQLKDKSKESELSKIYETLKEINSKKKFDKIVLSCKEGLVIIRIKEIINIHIELGVTYVNTISDGKIEVKKTLKEFVDLLPKDMFFQPHKSHIINIFCVEKLIHIDESIILSNGDSIPVARRQKEKLLTLVQK